MLQASLGTSVVLLALWVALLLHPWGPPVDSLLAFGALPLGMLALLGRDPGHYGLRWGPLRWWLGFVLPALVAVSGGLWVLQRLGLSPDYFAYYALSPQEDIRARALGAAGDLLPWEFLFRGFYLWMLWPAFGRGAILLQAVPFGLSHVGRPPLELWMSFPGGALVGWVAYRTRSFLPAFALHLGLDLATVLIAN